LATNDLTLRTVAGDCCVEVMSASMLVQEIKTCAAAGMEAMEAAQLNAKRAALSTAADCLPDDVRKMLLYTRAHGVGGLIT
jgi:hypothetical protein